MAINKKLIVFKSETNFKKELEAGNILPSSWVVIKDTKKLYVQNTEIEGVDWNKVESLIQGKISEIDFSQYLTEDALSNYVTLKELDDYVLKSEYTKITDGQENIISEIQIVDEDSENDIEIYTKKQCDDLFLKVWKGSEEEYGKLGTYDDKTIYIIL